MDQLYVQDEIARIVEIDDRLASVEDRVRRMRLANLDRMRVLVSPDVPVAVALRAV